MTAEFQYYHVFDEVSIKKQCLNVSVCVLESGCVWSDQPAAYLLYDLKCSIN